MTIETGNKTANINSKTLFITPVNGIMTHLKQQKYTAKVLSPFYIFSVFDVSLRR